jgi:hypothetical protein
MKKINKTKWSVSQQIESEETPAFRIVAVADSGNN